MRFDRKLGATLTVCSRLHPLALFAPRATVACFASRLRPHYSQSHSSVRRSCNRAILIGCTAIRNPRIPLKQQAMFFSNRSRIACLRAPFSRVLHATSHELRCTSRALLIATQILDIELTHSQQTRKHFLIATFFALRRVLDTSPLTSLDSHAALTTPHPSPTMKSVPCTLHQFAPCVAAVADRGSLITNHHSPITGLDHV
jgi:hypothetical protein